MRQTERAFCSPGRWKLYGLKPSKACRELWRESIRPYRRDVTPPGVSRMKPDTLLNSDSSKKRPRVLRCCGLDCMNGQSPSTGAREFSRALPTTSVTFGNLFGHSEGQLPHLHSISISALLFPRPGIWMRLQRSNTILKREIPIRST